MILPHKACIALGSNMGDSRAHLLDACDQIDALPDTRLLKQSDFLQTQPVGPIKQNVFLNAAVVVQTQRSAEDLLKALNAIEAQHGRDSQQTRIKWGPRPLDLDIIFYDDLICQTPSLTIPHPLMHERQFVLEPLCQIAPDWVHPKLNQTVRQLLANVIQQD